MARRRFSPRVAVGVLFLIPVVIPALSVLQFGPSVDQADAQELGQKQEFVSGPRSEDAPITATTNQASTNQAAKPSGKMGYVPASPSARDRSATTPRPVANPVARRTTPQPPKYAVAAGATPDAPLMQNPKTQSVASRPAKPQPNAVVSTRPKPAAAPQPSELPELPTETVAPATAIAEAREPIRTLDEPMLEEPMLDEPELEKHPKRATVQLFFEDEPDAAETGEPMDLDDSLAPPAKSEGIRHVAAQDDPAKSKAQPVEEPAEPVATNRKLMAEILADLKPVREINLGDAVKLPKLGDKDSKNVFEPEDEALAILRHRKPLNFLPVYREPWVANRDSYIFYHKPLWFEDPNLERCGRGWGHLTTPVSMTHFAANIAILPYRITAEKPCRCVRTLPDCTVCEKFGCEAYLPPWSLSAAAVQAAATVGLIAIIP